MRKRFIAVLLGAGVCVSCTSPMTATRVLEDQGYKNVQMTGYRWFVCDGKSDTFATGFSAVAPSGHRVTGAVCAGFLKGNTIRLD